MRPLKLKVSAFGPFGGEVNIDFSKFGLNNIVLISGDTGSGKTTIFDAITYALFARTSGGVREADMLRSDFANKDVLSFVELDFEYRNEVYKIKRLPRQLRPKKRGEGFTERAPEVYLYKGDKLLSSSNREADKKIEDVLGINYDQYKQIAMIAQGDFIKLIHSDTDTRSKIFRKLFNTKLYERLEYALKDKKRSLYNEYNNNKQKIDEVYIGIKKRDGSDLCLDGLTIRDNINIVEKYNSYLDSTVDKLRAHYNSFDDKKSKLTTKLVLAKGLNEDIIELNKVKEKLGELRSKESYYKELNEKLDLSDKSRVCYEIFIKREQLVKVCEEYRIELDLEEKTLEDLDLKLEEINSKLLNAEAEGKLVPELRLKIKLLEDEKIAIKETQSKNKELEECERKLKSLTSSLDTKNTELKKLSEELNAISETLIKEKDILKKEAHLSDFYKKIESDKEKLDVIKNEENSKKQLIEKRTKLKCELKQATIDLCSSKESYILALKGFLNSSAYHLSKSLKSGEECPVCGSRDHPNPYRHTGEEVSESDFNDTKEKYDNLSESVLRIKSDIDSNNKDAKRINELIKRLTSELVFDDIVKAKGEYDKEFTSYRELEANYNNSVKKIEELADIITKAKEEVLDYEKDILKVEGDIKRLTIDLDKLSSRCGNNSLEEIDKYIVENSSKIKMTLENIEKFKTDSKEVRGSRDDISARVIALTTTIKSSEKRVDEFTLELDAMLKEYSLKSNYFENIIDGIAYKSYREDLEKYREDYIKTKERFDTLDSKVEGKELIDVESIEREIESESSKLSKVKVLLDDANHLLKQNSNSLNRLKELEKRFEKIEVDYKIYEDLSDVVSGQLTGKDRLSLERYVQQIYFDDIIERANKRFISMTDSRYELLRKVGGYKGTKQIGLDLDVLDNYTNVVRDVKTLSGGESFKAALSLALGLSDIIKEYSGGVKIDTMFIDEGFGTLDEESLDRAINILSDLSENDILIGIISHVRELRNRIDKKIIVDKSASGSTISTII